MWREIFRTPILIIISTALTVICTVTGRKFDGNEEDFLYSVRIIGKSCLFQKEFMDMKSRFYSSKSKEEMMEIIMEFFSAECDKTDDRIKKYSMDNPIRRQQYGRWQSIFDLIRTLDIHDVKEGE
jgi:hypothetical protein